MTLLQLNATLAAFAPALANHLWQSTVFAAAAALLTLALRRNHARARHYIWMAASAKFLIPFALLVSLGGHFARPRKVATLPAMYFTVQDATEPFAAPIVPVASHSAAPAPIQPADLIPLAALTLWFAGFTAALTLWTTRWRRIVKALRTAVPVHTGRELEALRRIEQAAGLPPRLGLRILDGAMEPGVFGIARPILIWPAAISARLDDAQLEAILAHEVCHVSRRDNLTAAFHMLVQAAFWFHPLVWWLGARLVAERERACDEQVLEVCPRPAVYAQGILKVCEFCVESPLPCVSGVTGADLKHRVLQIMNSRAALRLTLPRKLLLAAAALFAIAAPVAFGVMRVVPLYGQILHATGPLPSYEVAAIKPSQQPAQGRDVEGEQVHLVVTAKLLVQLAYNVPMMNDSQVAGGPDWINTEVYDVLAKMDADTFAALQPMNRAQRRERFQLLDQSLLADRFKLKTHSETRDIPVLALVVAHGGPKLKPAKDTTPARATVISGGADPAAAESLRRGIVVTGKGHGFELTAKGVTLADLAKILIPRPEMGGRMVIDQTGLKGLYDFTLAWGPEQTATSDSGGDVEEPPLATALQQQLGLKLAQTKGPAEVIVIDHIERPTLDSVDLHPPARFIPASFSQGKPGHPEFEAATIKPNASGCCTSTRHSRDQMVMTNQTLKNLIVLAYAVQPYQVTGPAWLESERFDITAKYPPGTKFADRWPMLRTLLEDRFHLTTRRETRDMSGYSLLVDKGGFKLKPADPGEGVTSGGSHGHIWTLDARKIEMSTLAWELADSLREVVVDQTGLDGVYTFQLRWAVNDPNSPAANDADPAPSVFSAVQETLGLRLQHGKVPVPVIVVDHIDHTPTEN